MVFDDIQSHFEQLQEYMQHGPIVPHTTPEEIRTYLTSRYDFGKAIALDDLIADVDRMLKTWQVQVTHPRYFGLFNPSVTLASVIADTLAAMYNPQLAAWRTSPAANEIERHTLDWLTAKFGLPPESISTFTSGGNEANLSAVTVALTRAFPNYGEDSLRGLAAAPTIYLTQEAHHGYHKIAHIAGIGRKALRILATDGNLRLDLEDLSRQVEMDRSEGFAPFMVIGTAGTTAAGVIDPLTEIGRFCHDSGLWFHVDAAWGGAAILSPTLKPLLAGIETADSITCDAHKWFSVPMGCGMFFCRHPESVAQTFRGEPFYMPTKGSEPVFDPYTNSVQWSRRFIGLKLFMALAHHGEQGQVAMIEHQARMGELLRQELKKSGWRILNSTLLPLVCFTREGLDIAGFLASLRDRQIAWMSEVQLAGTPAVRACVTSYRTTEEEVRWVVGEMNRLVSHIAVALPAYA